MVIKKTRLDVSTITIFVVKVEFNLLQRSFHTAGMAHQILRNVSASSASLTVVSLAPFPHTHMPTFFFSFLIPELV